MGSPAAHAAAAVAVDPGMEAEPDRCGDNGSGSDDAGGGHMSTPPFVTVTADPAWAYDDGLTMSATKRGAASNYPTMSVQQICDLYTPSSLTGGGKLFHGTLAGHPLAMDGFLCLWATKDVLLEGIAQRVALEWGYTPKQIVPWVKGRIELARPRDGCHDLPDPRLILQTGLGRIFRNVVEYLIICTRGKYTKLVKSKSENGLILVEEDQVILAPRSQHSTKPEAAYAAIERVCPGPYLELFARKTRPGWTVWGNEVAGNGQAFERAEEPRLPIAEPALAVHEHPAIEWP
jgi:N6-adenosine-specific RNA methylase IME4